MQPRLDSEESRHKPWLHKTSMALTLCLCKLSAMPTGTFSPLDINLGQVGMSSVQDAKIGF